MDELKQLMPQPERLEIAGKAVEIWPLRARQISRFSAAVQPLLDVYNDVGRRGGLAALEILGYDEWAKIVGQHSDTLIAVLEVAIEDGTGWVGGLFLDDLILLAMRVFRVNADFFAQRLQPILAALLGTLTPMTPAEDGPTPSSDSSNPATANLQTTP